MRKIKMTSISAGPDGVRQIHTEHVLPAEEAAALVHSKHAVYIGGEPETAAIQPKEKAVKTGRNK